MFESPLTSISARAAAAAAAAVATPVIASPVLSTNTVRLLEVDDDSLGGLGVGATGAASVLIPGVRSADCEDIYKIIGKDKNQTMVMRREEWSHLLQTLVI